jgi:hypothetical protein
MRDPVVLQPDDPSYPWLLTAVLSPPEFMQFAFVMLYGNEQVRAIGESREALEAWAVENGITTHVRLRSLTYTERVVTNE